MHTASETVHAAGPVATLTERYRRVRSLTEALCAHLRAEDCVVQSMPDVSPTKWHLAHVTWFFERFVLEAFAPSYRCYDEHYHYLFNSYYYSAGQMHTRAHRGLLSRPTRDEVLAYRAHVDEQMEALLARETGHAELEQRVVLGLNHEQQHQELLLTDIKHVFSRNPMLPAVNPALPRPPAAAAAPLAFRTGASGIRQIGAAGEGFCFDNETPRHATLLHEHRIATRLVTNAEFLEFMRDGGYAEPALWLSDGWAAVNERGWRRPLYWSEDDEREFTLGGVRELDRDAPVTHISYYEADAFARWAGARLPTEAEWEVAAVEQAVAGNFVDDGYWQPRAGDGQWYGDVWEWTASSYAPYPGFTPLAGSLGEYNGKFMCNQLTVRGGSCVTSKEHVRASYRSFFYPDARWQFLGFRLAQDGAA
ncbi:MAG TPA: ergothioneine biosynthesis protein EgtB [Woeseiaceae bacterium]|nr:ergothioneine biosynthesis protein EgtB [Woeseiaceae bacterium]